MDDNTITSIMGRKSSIIFDLGDSTICNSLISAEKVLHGRGQFEGSTPKNNLSRCTEKKVVVYIFAMGNNLYLACWGWSAAALMSPCPGGQTSKLESNSNQVQFPQLLPLLHYHSNCQLSSQGMLRCQMQPCLSRVRRSSHVQSFLRNLYWWYFWI